MNILENQVNCQCNKPDCYFCSLRERGFVNTITTADVPAFNTPEGILYEICRLLEVSVDIIKSDCRTVECVIPRQLYCYFARKLTGAKFKAIADVVNFKNHSNAVSACSKVEHNLEIRDKKTVLAYEKCKMLLK